MNVADLPDGERPRTFKPLWGNSFDSAFPSFAFGSDSSRIAIASKDGPNPHAWVADVATGQTLLKLGSCCEIFSAPGGGWVVLPFGGEKKLIRVFDSTGICNWLPANVPPTSSTLFPLAHPHRSRSNYWEARPSSPGKRTA